MRDTNTVFLEVMRKDDLAKLNHYADVALKKFEDVAGRGTKDWQGLQRKERRFFRLSNKAASLELKKKAEEKAAAAAKWKGRAKVGAGVAAGAGLAYGAYRWNKNRQQKQKAMESTSECYTHLLREKGLNTRKNALMEVSDNRLAAAQKYAEHKVEQSRKFIDGHLNDMNKNFKPRIKPDSSAEIKDGYKELIRKEREQISINRAYIEKRKRQAERFKNALETRKAKANRAVNVRRAKIAGGVGAVGLGAYGAYRYYKHRKNQQQKAKESTSQYFARMLREAETRINADHIALGLNVLKATGFDQAMARQMGDDKQRSQAWKYGLRGAALGASLPLLDVGQENIRGLAHRIAAARADGVSGIRNILRTATDNHFGEYKPLPEQLMKAYGENPRLVGKITAGLAGAGALYGLMKKAPSDKNPTPTLMKPKKQYKYIRKDGDKYVYPKKIGVKK